MSNIQDSINLLVTEGTIEPYTFILATANHNHLGQIVCLDDKSIKVEVHSNQADKITFTTYKYYQNDNGELVEQPFWNEIQPLKYMYCVELDEYFIIDVELNDEHSEIKISKTKNTANIESCVTSFIWNIICISIPVCIIGKINN